MAPVERGVDQQALRLQLAPPADGNDIAVYLAAHDAGDGNAGDVVVWNEPKIAIPGEQAVRSPARMAIEAPPISNPAQKIHQVDNAPARLCPRWGLPQERKGAIQIPVPGK